MKYLRCLYIINKEYFLGILIKCVLKKNKKKKKWKARKKGKKIL